MSEASDAVDHLGDYATLLSEEITLAAHRVRADWDGHAADAAELHVTALCMAVEDLARTVVDAADQLRGVVSDIHAAHAAVDGSLGRLRQALHDLLEAGHDELLADEARARARASVRHIDTTLERLDRTSRSSLALTASLTRALERLTVAELPERYTHPLSGGMPPGAAAAALTPHMLEPSAPAAALPATPPPALSEAAQARLSPAPPNDPAAQGSGDISRASG